MVRQIRRLMRPIRTAEGHMMALAIYRVKHKGRWSFTPAKESGYEGVACLDDVARAAWLFLDVWERYGLIGARDLAEGFLAYIHAMQQPDGRFVNFVTNWRGQLNLDGRTSHPGGPPWTARAVMALARAYVALGQERDRQMVEKAWTHLPDHSQYKELRALHILAALEMDKATGDSRWLEDARNWAEEIMECRDEQGRLLNEPDTPHFHFWGHIQPGALALIGARLKWTPYVEAAEQSVRLMIEPVVRGRFPLPQVLPYDVSSVIFNLKCLVEVTLREEYRDLLHLARAWFWGRNTAGEPVYDPIQGLCHDGIDSNRVSHNSGAESNIEAAFALMEELPWPLLIGTGKGETITQEEETQARRNGASSPSVLVPHNPSRSSTRAERD